MSLSDWLTAQITAANDVFRGFVVFVVALMVFIASLRGGMGFASIVMALLTAALMWWALLGGGIEFVGELMQGQAEG